MGRIRRHWLAVLAALPFAPPVIKWVAWGVSRGGDADFIISRIEDPGWVGDMIEFVTNPPAWSILPLILAGLGLIYPDFRRNRRSPIAATASATTGAAPAPSQDRSVNEYRRLDGRSFLNQRIAVCDLLEDGDSPLISKCSFDTCLIVGPAVFLMNGGYFHGKTRIVSEGDIENVLIEIASDRPKVAGVVQLDHCVFKDCTFKLIGFMADSAGLAAFRAIFKTRE